MTLWDNLPLGGLRLLDHSAAKIRTDFMKLHPTTVTDAHFLTLKDFYTDIQQISLVQLAKSNPPSFEHPIFFQIREFWKKSKEKSSVFHNCASCA